MSLIISCRPMRFQFDCSSLTATYHTSLSVKLNHDIFITVAVPRNLDHVSLFWLASISEIVPNSCMSHSMQNLYCSDAVVDGVAFDGFEAGAGDHGDEFVLGHFGFASFFDGVGVG